MLTAAWVLIFRVFVYKCPGDGFIDIYALEDIWLI